MAKTIKRIGGNKVYEELDDNTINDLKKADADYNTNTTYTTKSKGVESLPTTPPKHYIPKAYDSGDTTIDTNTKRITKDDITSAGTKLIDSASELSPFLDNWMNKGLIDAQSKDTPPVRDYIVPTLHDTQVNVKPYIDSNAASANTGIRELRTTGDNVNAQAAGISRITANKMKADNEIYANKITTEEGLKRSNIDLGNKTIESNINTKFGNEALQKQHRDSIREMQSAQNANYQDDITGILNRRDKRKFQDEQIKLGYTTASLQGAKGAEFYHNTSGMTKEQIMRYYDNLPETDKIIQKGFYEQSIKAKAKGGKIKRLKY